MHAQFLTSRILIVGLAFCSLGLAQQTEPVRAIPAPATPFPSEADSAGVTKFSFFAYGDNRGRRDGKELQAEHREVVLSMIAQAKRLKDTQFPVKFVLQSGDAVADGAFPAQWNVSYSPLVEMLTQEADVPYFMVPGNHDVSQTSSLADPKRAPGMSNMMAAMANFIPAEGSPRRLTGYPTYAFGYGNTFVIGLDSNLRGDDVQLAWVKAQLEAVDHTRFKHIIVFCHQNVFSSGPHGGGTIEAQTLELRNRYMPVFRANHVDMVLSGHEHFFEHWVERYTDSSGPHRMDLIVSGGGGAPLYSYRQDPDTREYLRANTANQVRLQQLVQPGLAAGDNPHHFLVVTVDGDRLDVEFVGADWGVGYQPYRASKVDLTQ